MSSNYEKIKTGEKVGIFSVVVNLLLFIVKYWVGIVTGSIALIADAWHTLSDSISSIALIIGFVVARKPPDREHPYGHGRAELISTLVIGIILAIIGVGFFREAISRLLNNQSVVFGFWAKAVTILSIVVKELLAQVSFYYGKKNNSPSLKADAWHHRSDDLSSVIILFGIFFGHRFWWLDGVLGVIVSGLILYSAFDIMKTCIGDMLGKSVDDVTHKQLKKLVRDVTGEDVYLHHIHMHIYGDHKEITFHIKLPLDMPLVDAHDIASKIEERVRKELEIEATIHMEPLESD